MHGLLQGDAMWIEPAGHAQIHARGNTEAHRLQAPQKWVPYGVGAIEGRVAPPRPSQVGRGEGPTTHRVRSLDPARASPPAPHTASCCSQIWAS